MTAALVSSPRVAVANASPSVGTRVLAEEVAVALSYDGASHAVMMASPSDLEDFALGFSLSEGIVTAPGAITDTEIVERGDLGIEVRMRLAEAAGATLLRRRRMMAGPVGCGLCGIESLREATRPADRVTAPLRLRPGAVSAAMRALEAEQVLNRDARALHAAAFWTLADGLVAIREDVGRHNALDKLAGALARARVDGGTGVVVLTSRVSVEMVQKAARIGAPVLAAVSAPTALAIRTADACGITLVALVRGDGFEVFSHPTRVVGG
ncbi:formate dehydrogenase accessory sulfurtransferase FdhD [Roseomonas sp. CCTCC AB2023176]|uniref:formate dehydrogenase accessory sulfurtransferase FdhD n=1 Tax=Roseomonas sp. CCTCC AB2023176 TaxID=3342640 RepID=UPI0035D7C481